MTGLEPARFLCDPGSGVPVSAREAPEDFQVEELPLHAPSGSGDHLYLRVEAAGWSTPRLVDQLARAFGLHRREVGVAGLKDAKAITTQWFSVPLLASDRGHRDVAGATQAVDGLPGVRILASDRHPDPLRTGGHRGNRFDLRLRPPVPAPELGRPDPREGLEGWAHRAALRARQVVERMDRDGMPNWFGPQRFGARGDSDALGRALLHRRDGEALSWLLGRPSGLDTPRIRAARQAWDDGRLQEAFEHWPSSFREQREALRRLLRGASQATALKAIPRGLRRFLAHSVQSRIFNHVLAARLARHGELLPGDLAMDDAGSLHGIPSGGALLEETAHRGLLPTGPLPGRRCPRPEGLPGRLERRIFHRAGVGPRGELLNRGPGTLGARRRLVVVPEELRVSRGADSRGPFVRLQMTLPPGSYATALIREIDGRPDGIPGPLRPPAAPRQPGVSSGGQRRSASSPQVDR